MKPICPVIRNGAVLGPLPKAVGDNAENLVACFYTPDDLSVPVWLVMSPAAFRRKKVRAFAKLMAKQFKALGW